MTPPYELGPAMWPAAVLLVVAFRPPWTGRLAALRFLLFTIGALLLAPYAVTALT